MNDMDSSAKDQWLLTPAERELVMAKNRANRLGFAILLTFFREHGRFPRDETEVETQSIAVLSKQLDVPTPIDSKAFLTGRTVERLRTANWLTVVFVHHDQVNYRVIDLYLLQWRCHGGRLASCPLQVAGRILTFSAASGLERINAGNPQRHGVARWHSQLLCFTSLCDLAVERRQAGFLLGQEALLQQFADDALDRLRQTPFALAAAGLTASQIRHNPCALPGATDQDIDLPPGQTKRPSSDIGGLMPDCLKRCQWPDDFRSMPGLRPCLIRQSSHTLLDNR